MSFMPSPGSIVLVKGGYQGVVTKVTPRGEDDRVEISVTAWDIDQIIYEPEDDMEVMRVDGRAECPVCGRTYYEHEHLGKWGNTFYKACNGQVVKT